MGEFHLSKGLSVELEACRVIDESQVKGCSDQIALGGIVFFIVIVVNEVVGSVFLRSADVLEAFEIVGVSQNVVAVNALQSQTLVVLLRCLQFFKGVIGNDLQATEGISGIFFFLNCPVSVILVKTFPVDWNIFIESHVSDNATWNEL